MVDWGKKTQKKQFFEKKTDFERVFIAETEIFRKKYSINYPILKKKCRKLNIECDLKQKKSFFQIRGQYTSLLVKKKKRINITVVVWDKHTQKRPFFVKKSSI